MAKAKLSPESIAKIQQSQRMLHDILPDIDHLEECGVDCQLWRQSIQEAQNRSAKMLQYFGPGIGQQGQQQSQSSK